MQSINQTIQSIDIFDQCVILLSIPLRPWNLKDIFQNYHYSWSKEHLALNFAPNNPFPDIHSSTFQGAGVGNQKFHASHWPFAPVCFVLRSRLIPLISFIVTRSHLAFKTKVWLSVVLNLFLLKLMDLMGEIRQRCMRTNNSGRSGVVPLSDFKKIYATKRLKHWQLLAQGLRFVSRSLYKKNTLSNCSGTKRRGFLESISWMHSVHTSSTENGRTFICCIEDSFFPFHTSQMYI